MYDIDLNANFIKFLIISDTHIGNKKADMDLIYKAYEYAYSQNIYYVIHLGDVLDSIMLNNKNDLKIHDPNKQMKYVYNEYPYSDDIKTLIEDQERCYEAGTQKDKCYSVSLKTPNAQC